MTRKSWMSLVILLSALGMRAVHGQPSPTNPLAEVQRLKCAFTLMVMGTWNKEVPSAELTPAKLSIEFDAIDTQDGTANVVDVSSASAGAPHITVRLLGPNLHFLAMNTSGSVYLTTVFADKESQVVGRFKAVHTRHEFTPVRLTGWTSRPEQYYGQCEMAK